jgi:hypothetical protein
LASNANGDYLKVRCRPGVEGFSWRATPSIRAVRGRQQVRAARALPPDLVARVPRPVPQGQPDQEPPVVRQADSVHRPKMATEC